MPIGDFPRKRKERRSYHVSPASASHIAGILAAMLAHDLSPRIDVGRTTIEHVIVHLNSIAHKQLLSENP